ncbi:MAG: carbohydrate-binding protein [Chitinispirillaceae bacterium]|nr:carbohydrate-binding protein [Chitinispirillaceae bacterium]
MKKIMKVRLLASAVLTAAGLVVLPCPEIADAAVSQTPPMGWNSYDCLNHSVTEAQVKAAADFMAENLKEYGWEYICIDWAWYYTGNSTGSPTQDGSFNPPLAIDEYSRVLPDPAKFPSSANGQGFKPLADYIHGKGLKMGIHLMRGIPRQAVAANSPIKGSTAKANDIADKVNLCAWLNLMYGLNMNNTASQIYLNSLFELYASWGIDFVKVDDLINPYGAPAFRASEIEGYRKAIESCGREMVFSTSPGATPVANAAQIKKFANQWRMANDLWDKWDNLNTMFDLTNSWHTHAGPGHWPDADMIPIGRLNKHGPTGSERWSNLNSTEKHTMMTLWCIARSPLIWGGNLVENRAEELELMQNSEVIAVNQKSTNARPIVNGNTPVWCADIPGTNDRYVALFNRGGGAANVTVRFNDIGMSGSDTVKVRDLWAKSDKGAFTGSYSMSVPSHGCGLFRMAGTPPESRSAFDTIQAETINTQSGITVEEIGGGGEKIGKIDHRDFAVYAAIDFGDGADGFDARVFADKDLAIEIRIDSADGMLAGTCKIDGTGGGDNWMTVSCSLSVISGQHDLYLIFSGEYDDLADVDWFGFTREVVHTEKKVSGYVPEHYTTRLTEGRITVVPENRWGKYVVTLHTPDGRLVARRNVMEGPVTMALGSKGVYIVRIAGRGTTVEKRVMRY